MKRAAWIALGALALVILALLLGPHTSYRPGPMLAGHRHLGGDCAACHRPWEPPANAACITCHGDFASNNPHGGFDVTDATDGLIVGRRLVTFDNQLSCLSCHGEHQGAVAVRVTAAFACTYCHKHPAIEQVSKHQEQAFQRPNIVKHLFAQLFNHQQHKLLLTGSYPPRPFACVSCHLVESVPPGGAERMSIKWSGCGGTLCHSQPQGGYLDLPVSIGPAPATIAYSSVIRVRHLNAVFVHSQGHLQSACETCHFKAADSQNPDDEDALTVKRCFNCHTHQPAARPVEVKTAATGMAWAATNAEVRVVACGQCHLFHLHGVVPLPDFTTVALRFPPAAEEPETLTLSVPGIVKAVGIQSRALRIVPWSMGFVMLLALCGAAYGLLQLLPARARPYEAVSGVAPQRQHQVPELDDTFQTNIPNLYVVGETAGTASINLAMRSGRQVVEAIQSKLQHGSHPVAPELYDVAIVGCGPSGLAATATAKAAGLKYVTLEKLTPAATLKSYPRAKFVQATPIDIEEYGTFFLEGDSSREQLIEEWERIIDRTGLVINDREEVVDIKPGSDGLEIRTRAGHQFKTLNVVLAVGVRGNPRHLNVPGEDPQRVQYNLIEPGEFTGRKLLVVGGGNAGAEVAQALAQPQLRNTVSYSFRTAVLSNVTRENAEKVSALARKGVLRLYPASVPREIRPTSVVLQAASAAQTPVKPGLIEIENDLVFAMVGAELPAGFLSAIGVKLIAKG